MGITVWRLAILVIVAALCGLAAAPTARSDGVLNSIASKLATSGANAPIAKRLEATLSRLRRHESCPLSPIVGDAEAALVQLIDTSSTEETYRDLTAKQAALHKEVNGPHGLLVACARHIETQMSPFLTSQLAPAVWDVYATYKAAALALLLVRVSIHSSDASITQTLHRIELEQRWIRPAVPSGLSYDKSRDLVFKTRPYSSHNSVGDRLAQNGWWVTGISPFPSCSTMLAVAADTGKHGAQAVAELARLNVFHTGEGVISCYEPRTAHLSVQRVLDLKTGRYETGFAPGLEIALHRSGPGLLEPSKYSYIVK